MKLAVPVAQPARAMGEAAFALAKARLDTVGRSFKRVRLTFDFAEESDAEDAGGICFVAMHISYSTSRQCRTYRESNTTKNKESR